MSHSVNYYGRQLTAYRASLHSHCTVSDGSFVPEELIRLYHDQGYEILAFSDHMHTNPVSEYDGLGMQLISGMEAHPMGPRNVRWHLLCLGVPEDFADPSENSVQDCIDMVRAVDGLVFCAHPTWCGFRSGDVAALKNLSGIEVYNSACRIVGGKPFSITCWDELADEGIIMNAIAVDDVHRPGDLFHGWTMVMTDQPLSAGAVLDALKNGDFYATQGPEIYSVTFDGEYLKATFSPCTEVLGISNLWYGCAEMCEDFTGPQDGIQEITSCCFQLKNGNLANYFRLQLKDRNGKYAWSNPLSINRG